MASTIAAITTGTGGVVTTADASGNLSLLSGATTVVAVTSAGVDVTGTLAATGAVTLTGSLNTPNTFGFKNRIINGGMVIDQRNAGAAISVTSAEFPVDRFYVVANASGVISAQRSSTAPQGFTNSTSLTVTTARASIAAGDVYGYRQIIEGYNTADLGWGTANAQSVTLSFWVRSSITGTYTISIFNAAFNRSYISTYTINAANTFEQKTITITGDTTGTWNTDNSASLNVYWDLGSGSTYYGTAGAWAAVGAVRTSGSTNWISTLSATFYITGVQLEKGSTATSFDFRDYGRELAMCQRYFETTFDIGTAPANNLGVGVGEVLFSSPAAGGGISPNMYFSYPYKVTKRTPPTITFYNCRSATAGTFSGFVAAVRSDTVPNLNYSTNTVIVVNTALLNCSLAAGAMTFSSEL
jgi:hypothetical protein